MLLRLRKMLGKSVGNLTKWQERRCARVEGNDRNIFIRPGGCTLLEVVRAHMMPKEVSTLNLNNYFRLHVSLSFRTCITLKVFIMLIGLESLPSRIWAKQSQAMYDQF